MWVRKTFGMSLTLNREKPTLLVEKSMQLSAQGCSEGLQGETEKNFLICSADKREMCMNDWAGKRGACEKMHFVVRRKSGNKDIEALRLSRCCMLHRSSAEHQHFYASIDLEGTVCGCY